MISFAFSQLETKTGKAAAATLSAGDPLEPADLKVALKREREEHRHLLAESYAAVMDLTKQVASSGNETRTFVTVALNVVLMSICRHSAADRGEKLGQGEAGAAGEIQPGESSVGAEAERGHHAAGDGRTRVCARVCN